MEERLEMGSSEKRLFTNREGEQGRIRVRHAYLRGRFYSLVRQYWKGGNPWRGYRRATAVVGFMLKGKAIPFNLVGCW